ncbi:CPBP family intramembrane glutamic endopeptidase [Streptomyces sp. PSKA30]|uniref:CPBP family intramembrane glutamic endopeptidase n=1 Tax=Streptomyces sp. PSKA30 TaxID=2874597 RepID=UPI001CD09FEC|nr:CPBP family intramembrane glutamic endopeptidase [Streptomyces sp. PSKA30]MBZ9642695.1 CPBP family intramembrane metalloprotease [Streptomyces sp. PSKA30]
MNSHNHAPAAGTPYHRLARTMLHRWWLPLAATLVAVVGWLLLTLNAGFGLGVAASLAGVELGTGDLLFADPLWDNAAWLLMLALLLPAVLLAARLVQRRPVGTLSSVTGRLRRRWLLVCLGVAVAATLLLFGLITVFTAVSGSEAFESTSAAWVGWPAFLAAAAMLVLLVPLQAAAEEYVFRGWIPQVFGCYLRTPWVGITVGGLLFALSHGLGTPWGFADLVLFSLVLGVLVIRTGGLEAAIALHVVNNLFFFLFSATVVDGLSDTTTNAGDAPWALLAAEAIVLPLYAWVVLRLSRRFRIARTTPDPTRRLAEPAATTA